MELFLHNLVLLQVVSEHVDRMLARWAAYFERFNYLIVHKSGATNKVAEAFRRRACLLTSVEAALPVMDQIKE